MPKAEMASAPGEHTVRVKALYNVMQSIEVRPGLPNGQARVQNKCLPGPIAQHPPRRAPS